MSVLPTIGCGDELAEVNTFTHQHPAIHRRSVGVWEFLPPYLTLQFPAGTSRLERYNNAIPLTPLRLNLIELGMTGLQWASRCTWQQHTCASVFIHQRRYLFKRLRLTWFWSNMKCCLQNTYKMQVQATGRPSYEVPTLAEMGFSENPCSRCSLVNQLLSFVLLEARVHAVHHLNAALHWPFSQCLDDQMQPRDCLVSIIYNSLILRVYIVYTIIYILYNIWCKYSGIVSAFNKDSTSLHTY